MIIVSVNDKRSMGSWRQHAAGRPACRRPSGGHVLMTAIAAIFVLYLFTSRNSGSQAKSPKYAADYSHQSQYDVGNSYAFDWSTIEPSKDLEYHPCYDKLQCARLSVPLDWFNGTNPDKTVSIAVVRVPAKVPVTDSRYNGPIFINPGGPGGSGTMFAAFTGNALQRFVDSDAPAAEASNASANKYHDIIGFDPRGVGETTPGAFCYDDEDYRWTWLWRMLEEGLPGASNAALGRLLSMNRAFGATCNTKAKQEDSILRFISTASVSRDLLELSEKDNDWRKKERKRIRSIVGSRFGVRPLETPSLNGEHIEEDSKDAKLNFWGFSYGTHIGATYASMFPHRVGRMILDGVLEPADFINQHWVGSLEDTEKALQYFYDHCAAAGPEDPEDASIGCSLAVNGSTSADIRERFQDILTSLWHNPFPFEGPSGPDVLSYSTMKSWVFSSLYSPVLLFGVLARALRAIEEKNSPLVSKFAAAYLPFSGRTAVAPRPALANDAGPVVGCADGDPMDDLNIDWWQHAAREISAVSPTGGGVLAMVHLRCAGWKTRNYRFAGPFGGTTSTPILWIGNTADPICPVKSAYNQAARFPGSSVLVHDAPGHCSLTAYSDCTAAAIRSYFHNGTLPSSGTVCPVQQFPFNKPLHGQLSAALPRTGEVDHIEALAAHEEMRNVFSDLGFGYGVPPRYGSFKSQALRSLGVKLAT